LVELLAYVGDYLSYRQESVATEAYLGTARKRISVRRHARLVDYPMHDGCNARVWVHVAVEPTAPASGIVLKRFDPITGAPTRFLARCDAAPLLGDAAADAVIAAQRPEVFEQLDADVTLFEPLNQIAFYTWGAADCCLPVGATRATLAKALDMLEVGRVLIFEEILGSNGNVADADRSHRHAVRLTHVKLSKDPLGGRFLTPPTDDPVDVTEIEWDVTDALPFPLCISSTILDAGGAKTAIAVGVARGNVVLADHGKSVVEALPEPVPAPAIRKLAPDADACQHPEPSWIPARFAPTLAQPSVTRAAPYDDTRPAAGAMRFDVATARPEVHLESGAAKMNWTAVPDLLGSGGDALDFVVEVESDGVAQLRFGDGRNGRRPAAGTTFTAFYRVGNGLRGNVGAEAIAHVATSTAGIASVRNPLPASGGVDPEPIEQVRRFAPEAFRTQERAVTEGDYAEKTELHPAVQRAAATFRWTGSWRTAFVTVDPLGGAEVDEDLDDALTAHLERYRMAGQDVEVDGPRYVPLEIEMHVCAKRGYFRSDVQRALLEVFGSGVLRDGRKGVFHPDRFTFGQTVFLSPLYAAALAIDGVESVNVLTFQRRGTPDPKPLQEGKLELARLEIARLDNDPSRPDRGVFVVSVGGGE
ncbi:MAG TPA: putative baseplate assembly protein, partial [Planctomycetota bacterium]|nr:putative baseplate assembly protein [Planctomycetota bacterium]